MSYDRAMRKGPLGVYRRAVRLRARETWVSAEMEDDVHHFEAILHHDGERVLRVEAYGHRTPWTACDGAAGELKRLEGLALADLPALASPTRVQHCLHLFDLVQFAASHAVHPGFERLYRAEVDFADPAVPSARLERDGEEILAWRLRGDVVEGGLFDGSRLVDVARQLGSLSDDDREAALIFRRASIIGQVRRSDLDAFDTPHDLRAHEQQATCFAQQLPQRTDAKRHRGSSRDLWGDGVWPLTAGPSISHGDAPPSR